MLNYEINNKLSEKREYDLYLSKEILKIYINLLLFVDNSREARENLINFYIDNLEYSKLEKDIFNKIKRLKDSNKYDECRDMIDDMDSIFLKIFQYNEWILSGYDDALETGEMFRASIPNKKFNIITEEEKNEFIKRIKR